MHVPSVQAGAHQSGRQFNLLSDDCYRSVIYFLMLDREASLAS